MLTPGLVERLSALKLHGMAQALEDIHNSTAGADLSFDDRLTLMIDHEEATRLSRALKRRLQVATAVPGTKILRSSLFCLPTVDPYPSHARSRKAAPGFGSENISLRSRPG